MHIKSLAQFHREPGKRLPSSGRRDIGGFAGAAPDRERDILFQTGSVFPGGESVYDRAMPRPAKPALARIARTLCRRADRQSVVWVKRVSVRVDIGGRGTVKQQQATDVNRVV